MTRDLALEFVLRDLPSDLSSDLQASLGDQWNGSVEPGFRALDPALDSEGGAAFLWEDVLALGDFVDACQAVLEGFPPNEAAKLLLNLLSVWRRLRKTRVILDEAEFKVMRAVKRGRRTPPDIAAYTMLDESTVSNVIARLKGRLYRDEIVLIEESADGLTTRF